MMRALAAAAALALAACAGIPEPRTYANPVLARDFPDPAVLLAPDGLYYAYATQGEADGRPLHIQVARSADLVSWTLLGDALPTRPAWASRKRDQKFWAPHVIHDAPAGRYVMYYSAEPDAAEGKCLAVAIAEAPAGPYADSGRPLLCGEGIEHIDPMAFDDPRTGKRLLYWGSGGQPILAQELAPDRVAFLAGTAPRAVLSPDARPYRSLIEGAWVTYRDGWYYLFHSGDRCCTREPRYAVLVARAMEALGPFEARDEPLVSASGPWLAPGHNSVVTDAGGADWMLFHAYAAGSGTRERMMLLERIVYEAGWPTVPSGASRSPQAAPSPAR